jgi:hypothetical protein
LRTLHLTDQFCQHYIQCYLNPNILASLHCNWHSTQECWVPTYTSK